jgi:hypothetical protein
MILKAKILCFPKMKAGNYAMPSTVTQISDAQFKDCVNLTSIALSSNLENIPNNAFQGCSQISLISIPASVQSIGDYAFDGCTSLLKLIIEDGDEPLTIGRGMNGFDTYLENTWTWFYPQFYQLPLQEVYWRRNITCEYPTFPCRGITKTSI